LRAIMATESVGRIGMSVLHSGVRQGSWRQRHTPRTEGERISHLALDREE
jgi:hypothetical protein